MSKSINVATAPKTSTFQMRINPVVRAEAEAIFAQCGITMTDAINAFLQQSINVGGLPFLLTQDNKTILHKQAITWLMSELQKGEESVTAAEPLIAEADILAEFGSKQ